MRVRFFLLPLLIGSTEAATEPYTPYYTGTLLSYFSENIPPGRLLVEPYLYQTRFGGAYDGGGSFHKKQTVNQTGLQLLLETGITPFLDFTLLLTTSYNQQGNHHAYPFRDIQAFFGLQLLEDTPGTAVPDLRLLVGETFPTGRYRQFDPKKNLIQDGGAGTYQTIFVFILSKTFHPFPKHPFNLNLNLESIVSTKTRVSGSNFYGGSPETTGTVSPGTEYIGNLALEFSLTQKWVVGADIHYLFQQQSPFSGNPGPLSVGSPLISQFSLAPCLEYSYNENFGMLGGVWFTVTGRNSSQFASAVFSVYYEF